MPFPLIGAFVLFPILAVSAVAMLFPAVRTSLLAVPTSTLVGLNIARALGFFFILLACMGRQIGSQPFPQSAGWGDVITGVLAVVIMRFASQGTAGGDRAVWIWNAFGTLDLLAAVTLGVTSADGSPLQLIHAGTGLAAVQLLPWSLIPTVLVPFYLITHGIIFSQLLARMQCVSKSYRIRDSVVR